ncbi:FAD-NAD(P)-binding-domain-containing protein [Annulohypoxylon moriforme]|nr:FAD-NAD(P)-binding-domain-containing protein [Annulohypoxylon moriforme]
MMVVRNPFSLPSLRAALRTPLNVGRTRSYAYYSPIASAKPGAAIAIVGSGPMGAIILDRICESARHLGDRGELTVHAIDPTRLRSGAVWDTEQSTHLLMNTKASQMTQFNETMTPLRPALLTPNLEQWAVREGYGHTLSNGYAPRYVYGKYLSWCFNEVMRNAPRQVKCQTHVARAISLEDEEGGLQSVRLDTGLKLSGLSAVILAQGHSPVLPDPEQYRQMMYTQQHPGLRYIPPANPGNVNLSSIKPDEKVLLRGLGLTFFDYMALLTLGRGGRFSRDDEGNLQYHASGKEPRIYASSRRGLPHRARGELKDGTYSNYKSIFLTEKVIADFRRRAASGDAPDFSTEILPLIKKEVELAYYEALLGRDQSKRIDFRARFLRSRNPAHLLKEAGISESDRWCWNYMARPYHGRDFTSAADWKDWLLGYFNEDLAQAKGINGKEAVCVALYALRGLRSPIRRIVNFGGLTGDSRRDDFNKRYTPLINYLSVGPPLERIEQLVALIKANVVTLIGPDLKVVAQNGHWLVSSPSVPNSAESVTALIEARVAETDLKRSADELLISLREKGQCRPHSSNGYETGGLDVTRSPFHLIDRNGIPHRRRFALGVPTEGVHWITTAGPGENLAIAMEAEQLSHAAVDVANSDMAEATAEATAEIMVEDMAGVSSVEGELVAAVG